MLTFIDTSRYAYTTRVTRDAQPFGEITGHAALRHDSPSRTLARVHLAEIGVWTAGPHTGVGVTNAWFAQQRKLEPDGPAEPAIEIHRGHGPAAGRGSSGYLLTLVGGPTDWHTQHPHPCAQDSYSLTVHTEPGGLVVLDWTVLGPAKNHGLLTTYTPDP